MDYFKEDAYVFEFDMNILIKELEKTNSKTGKNKDLISFYKFPSKNNFGMFIKIVEKLKNLKTHLMAIHISNFLLYSIYRFMQTHKSEFELLNDDNKQKIENYEEIKKQNVELQITNEKLIEEKFILENKILSNNKEKLDLKNEILFDENFKNIKFEKNEKNEKK